MAPASKPPPSSLLLNLHAFTWAASSPCLYPTTGLLAWQCLKCGEDDLPCPSGISCAVMLVFSREPLYGVGDSLTPAFAAGH